MVSTIMTNTFDNEAVKQRQKIAELVSIAKSIADKNADQADLLHQQAVSTAETRFGRYSIDTALALLEQQEFYERQGNRSETSLIRAKIRRILNALLLTPPGRTDRDS